MEFPEEVGHLNDEELRRGLLEWNSRQGSKDEDGAEHHGK